jgi:hypothetical protein
MPVALEKEHKDSDGKLNQAGWEFLSSLIRTRIELPYIVPGPEGFPSIPVEWVKEVNHAINRGAVSGGKNVAVIDAIDAMNKESANAMLATLEEPPENTHILLMTSRPQAVLPTIASRCQLLRFGLLPASDIRHARQSRYGADAGAAALDQATEYSLGSLGRAIELYENPPGELDREAWSLFEGCVAGDWPAVASRVDELARRGDEAGSERLLMHLVYLFRGEMLRGVSDGVGAGSAVDGEGEDRRALSLDRPDGAWKLFRACQGAIDGVRAHGNTAIVLVNFVTTCMEIIREQKQ